MLDRSKNGLFEVFSISLNFHSKVLIDFCKKKSINHWNSLPVSLANV